MPIEGFADFRSDTFTRPTPEMRRAMAEAVVGDDVFGEDPTARRLEELAAARVGKEAALFVPTGCMGNEIAFLVATQRGDEVVVEEDSHVFLHERAGLAVLSGVQARPLRGREGILQASQIEAAIRGGDIHEPRTSAVGIEHPHNLAGGTLTPLEELDAIGALTRERGLHFHLDGARLFHAAIATGHAPARICRDVDSVMFCLSKGLSAPVGSMLAGSAAFIQEARAARKLLGGGMRQVGVLAAAGIVALESMVDRLAEDHARARRLAESLAEVAGIEIAAARVRTNILVARIDGAAGFVEHLEQEGVRALAVAADRVRFVTHREVDDDDVERAARAARSWRAGTG